MISVLLKYCNVQRSILNRKAVLPSTTALFKEFENGKIQLNYEI